MGLGKDCNLELNAFFEKGKLNLISDVKGVSVGHITHKSKDHNVNTGVTVVMPCDGNIFREKLLCGCSVINGYGKSVGLIQIEEMGTLESPIFLTNTLSVGTVLTGAVKYMLQNNPEIGVSTGSVNCVVTECNDGPMNDIRGLFVKEDDVFLAIQDAKADFLEGAVGAGTGMCMMNLKGGIGSASRLCVVDEKTYTIGALALTNYGSLPHFIFGTRALGKQLSKGKNEDKGSCILIIATDAPISSRQLKRLSNRAAHALAKTGSYSGNGSGDIALAFSTANKIPHFPQKAEISFSFLHDDYLSDLFAASVEAMEEALLSSLWHGESMEGIRGKKLQSLQDAMKTL